MKKIMSFMLALAIILTCLPALTAKAETSEITIDFSTTAQRTDFSTQQQVWKNGDLTFTNNKAASSNNVADYPNASYAHVRLYKSSSATIECPNMVQITFVGAGSSTYKTPIGNTLTAEGYTPTVDGDKYTITFAEPVDSFSISSFTAQVRMSSIVVVVQNSSGSEGGSGDDTSAEVSFDLNYEGATDAPETVTVEVGSAYGELPAEPSREGCTFVGWFADAEGTGEAVKESDIVKGPQTLYAKWFEVVESEVGDTTIDFSSTTHRVSWDANSQVWTNGGITLTNSKGSSTSNVADYSNPARFYKSTSMEIVCNGNYMSKIEFTASAASYATDLGNSIAEDGNYTVAVDGKLVTVTFNKAVESFDFALSGGQVRMDKMVVTVVDSAEEEAPVVVEEWGMTLEDEIIVNFTMTLSAAIKNDANAYVEVSIGGETYNVPAAQVGDIFKVPVNATQMNDTISLCVVDGNGVRTEAGSATIRQYCDAILADPDQAAYYTLVKEMLNYGSAAQLHFGHNTDNLAGQGIEDAGQKDVPAEGGEIGLEDKIEEVDCIGASLVYRDKIAVRYYFEGDLTGCTFAVNGTPSDLQVNGNYVEVADIVPQDLDKQVILTVTDAQGNAITVTYCPMSYIIRMSQKGSDTTKALVKALYNYHLAAKDFSGS